MEQSKLIQPRPTEPKPGNGTPTTASEPQKAQVFVVPAPLWAQVVKRLGKMSYEDVGDLMPQLMQVGSQIVDVKPKE